MPIAQLITEIQHQLQQTSMPEAIAVLFGVASVLLASRNNVWLYPTGIISSGIYIWFYITLKLYADSSLNVYYFVMSIYGWVVWTRSKTDDSASKITVNSSKDWIIASIAALIATIGLYLFLRYATDSPTPVWDAVVSGLAYVGMWQLARHKAENWLWLNASNALAVPLYFLKGIPFTALLTIFLFIVAVFGYISWLRIYKRSLQPATAV